MLELEGVTFRYPGAVRAALSDLSVSIGGGEVVGVVGAAEAGKSTLCLVGGGLAPRTVRGVLAGRVILDGVDAATLATHELVSLVATGLGDPRTQLSGICETVYEEVAFGPANLGVPHAELLARVDEVLERLGIIGLAGRHPERLSGGQQQLVAIAGLLAMRPRHLVLDEPTAELDRTGTRMVFEAVAELARAGVGVLIAAHAADELARVCDRVVVLDAGRRALEGPAADVLADPRLRALGVAEPAHVRLARMAVEAGLDPALLATDGGPDR